MLLRTPTLLLALLLAPALAGAAATSSASREEKIKAIPTLEKKVDFETDLLPIFKHNCTACHSEADAEADLVLETPQTILKGSEDGPVVVPHDPVRSGLLKSAAQLSKPLMPPKNNKIGAEPMTSEELSILKTWIEQGATGTVNAKPKPLQWRPLPPGLHPILAVAITGDGEFAACGRANQIFMYHLPSGQMVTRLIDPRLAAKPNRSGYRSSAERDFVQALAFSPDGKTLASGEYRIVKLWQREAEAPLFILGTAPVTTVATSQDGKWIATTGAGNLIHIWDATNGKPVKDLTGHTGKINSLKFSPDSSKLLSGSADKTLRVWDITAGKVCAQTETPAEVNAVAWTLNGKQIAAAGDAVIHQWQLPAQADAPLTPGKDLTGHTQSVTCLDVFPDGKQLLSGSRDGSVRLWNVEASKQVRQMAHGAPVVSVSVSPTSKGVASAGGNSAKLWSVDRGQMLQELKGDPAARMRAARGEQAIDRARNNVTSAKTALDAATKAVPAKADALKKANDALTAAKGDAKKTTTAEKALKEAQVASQQAIQTLADAKAAMDKATAAQRKAEADTAQAKKDAADSEKPVNFVAFSPSGLLIATGGDDGIVRTWSPNNGAGFLSYPGGNGPIQALTFTGDGKVVACASKQGAIAWNSAPHWTLVRTIGTGDEKSPLVNRVLTLDFSPDGQLLATGGGVPSRSGELKLWRVADGSLVREIKPSHSDTVFCVSFSPDGKSLATGSADKFAKVFDVSSGKLLKTLAGHTHYVLSVSWSADGHTIATSGADKAVKLWSYPGGDPIKSIEDFKKEVTSVRFVDDKLLVASGEARVRLMKQDGGNVKDYQGSKGYIFSTAVTPDGQTILGGGQDSVLRIWNVPTGKSLFTLDPPEPELPPKSSSKSTKK